MADILRIQHNVTALFAERQLSHTSRSLQRSLERLSSGFRINRAADDAAGLAISEKLRTQVRGYDQAVRNVQDGVSLIQTAEGGFQEVHNILQRIRTLAIQSSNDTNTDSDRTLIQAEVNQLVAEVDRLSTAVQFNTRALLDGSYASGQGSLLIHAGANQNQTVTLNISSLTAAGLGINGLSIATQAEAEAAIPTLDTAIDRVSNNRALLGAAQNRLESTLNFLGVQLENISAAESRIRDADIAQEVVSLTKNQILVQAGTAVLAQANIAPQLVLQLF